MSRAQGTHQPQGVRGTNMARASQDSPPELSGEGGGSPALPGLWTERTLLLGQMVRECGQQGRGKTARTSVVGGGGGSEGQH